MSIEKIMKLAEEQANARVEAAQANLNAINAQMAQLQVTRQLAINELTAANAAKAKLEGVLDEYCETQEQPKNTPSPLKKELNRIIEDKEQSEAQNPAGWSLSRPLLTVYAAHNGAVGMSECWFVVAATTKEDAENLIKEATKGAGIKHLAVREADRYNNKLDKKAAEKAKEKPNTVFIL